MLCRNFFSIHLCHAAGCCCCCSELVELLIHSSVNRVSEDGQIATQRHYQIVKQVIHEPCLTPLVSEAQIHWPLTTSLQQTGGGSLRKALADISRAIRLVPQRPDYYQLLGNVCMEAGQSFV